MYFDHSAFTYLRHDFRTFPDLCSTHVVYTHTCLSALLYTCDLTVPPPVPSMALPRTLPLSKPPPGPRLPLRFHRPAATGAPTLLTPDTKLTSLATSPRATTTQDIKPLTPVVSPLAPTNKGFSPRTPIPPSCPHLQHCTTIWGAFPTSCEPGSCSSHLIRSSTHSTTKSSRQTRWSKGR